MWGYVYEYAGVVFLAILVHANLFSGAMESMSTWISRTSLRMALAALWLAGAAGGWAADTAGSAPTEVTNMKNV